MTSIKAIPTMYAGVQFRSRLEARWAAFFDLLEWKWDYEPFDCDGYIPDFLLFDRMLVEIKPITWGKTEDSVQIAKAQTLLVSAFRDHRFGWLALFGAGLHEYTPGAALIGRIAEREEQSTGYCAWRDAEINHWRSNHEISVDGQPLLGSRMVLTNSFTSLWREAGNRVQWRSPRKTQPKPAQYGNLVPKEEIFAGWHSVLAELEGED